MNQRLKHLLEEEHSKRQKDIITQEILSGNIPIEDLIDVIYSNDGIYAQRGAYVITGLHDKGAHHLQPYIRKLIDSVQPKSHQAIARCVYRFLADIHIPEEFEGELFEEGMRKFMSKHTEIAIKAHLMTILSNISLKYPELKTEVIYAIKEQLPESSKGYQSRAKKELKKLENH